MVRRNSADRLEIYDRLPKNLDPYFCGTLSGFVMGEGSFYVTIRKSKTIKVGWQIEPQFEIKLKDDDFEILGKYSKLLGCGKVIKGEGDVRLIVRKFQDIIEVIIPFFDQFPLLNIKKRDYEIFKIICYKILQGETQHVEGLRRILTLRDQMNRGGSRKEIYI